MKGELTWTTDEFGRALVAGLHDSRISRIAFADGQYLHLEVTSASGKLVSIELSGIGDVNLRDVCNGSIVATVYAWKVRSVPRSSWDVPNSGWNLLFANRLAKADVKEAAARIALNRPQSLFVQVECSYGGALAAVCDRVAFLSEATPLENAANKQ